jgi:nucleotide-binding universal stress UspA family protein
MRKVVAALDNSAAAGSVLATAQSLAAVFGAGVEAVHVGEDGERIAAGAAGAAGLELRRLGGPVVPALARAAVDPDAVALVVGTRGLPGGRKVGSTALELITSVRRPVVVVPPDVREAGALKRVLVPLEGTPLTSLAPTEMIQLAQDADVEILVLHVHDAASLPAFTDQPQHEADAWREEFVARYCPWGIGNVSMQIRVGRREEEVVAAAAELGADLVAIGWAQRLAAGRAPIVREVLERGRTPVLLIPLRVPSRSRSRKRRTSWNSLQSSPARSREQSHRRQS